MRFGWVSVVAGLTLGASLAACDRSAAPSEDLEQNARTAAFFADHLG